MFCCDRTACYTCDVIFHANATSLGLMWIRLAMWALGLGRSTISNEDDETMILETTLEVLEQNFIAEAWLKLIDLFV